MKKGFTLLEVLISAIVLTIGVAAIVGAFNSGLFATTDVGDVEGALNVAQLRMEEIFAELKSMDFAVLTKTNLEDFEDRKSDTTSGYDITVDLYEDDLDLSAGQNLMQADVTAAWDAKGGQASVILTTQVADY